MKTNNLSHSGTHVGCPHCPRNPLILTVSTVLFFEFGGWIVYKDEHVFYMCGDENPKTLAEIEKEASVFPESTWIAELSLPLRGAKYKRTEEGVWGLFEENIGFA